MNLLRLAPAKEVEGEPCARKFDSLPGTSLLLIGALALAGCGSDNNDDAGTVGKTLVVATHNSWGMSEEVMAEFKKQTGITVKIATNGDAGELTNKLVLTKGDPIADGVYGIDNTFATRAVDAGRAGDVPTAGRSGLG